MIPVVKLSLSRDASHPGNYLPTTEDIPHGILGFIPQENYLHIRRKLYTMETQTKSVSTSSFKTIDIVYIAVFAALMAICSWISIPTTVPFTLQTFAVFLAVRLLGGKRGTLSVLVYILLGAIGVPVFAGFSGGFGVILGSTGGYIIGFIASALIMWAFEKWVGRKNWMYAISMLLGLIACYAIGTVWFNAIYVSEDGSKAGLIATLSWCVFPFIIPDIIKIALAMIIGSNRQLQKLINNTNTPIEESSK